MHWLWGDVESETRGRPRPLCRAQELRFASDSPLEGAGFELPVPRIIMLAVRCGRGCRARVPFTIFAARTPFGWVGPASHRSPIRGASPCGSLWRAVQRGQPNRSIISGCASWFRDFAPEMLMLLARAFTRAELDPGRSLQEAMVSAMEARSDLRPTASTEEEILDHFAELAAELDNDPFAIYAELASTAAVFPAEHQASMAGALSGSDNEAVREAALGFAFSSDPAVSSAALVAITQEGRAGRESNSVVDRLVRMRPWLSERRRAKIDTAVRALRPKTASPVPLARWEIRSVLASLCEWRRRAEPVRAHQARAPLCAGIPAGKDAGWRRRCLGARGHDQG
jgi:hypothetical protein